MHQPLHRRSFLKQGASTALGYTLLPGFLRRPAPSDRLQMAIVGLGGMGTAHLKWFAALPDVEVVALCDVDSERLDKALATLKELNPGSKAQGYGDFRRILDRKDIGALSCATPDHWHAQVATLAFAAGKDVYGEKPLSYDVLEGRRLLQAQKKYNRIFQMGTQIHATDNYHRVAELIRGGAIGKVHTVRLWKTGAPPELGAAKVMAPPPNLNWDMWLGPAPYTAYMPQRCHFTYRYFLDYSGGVFADFWCHIADVAFWALNPQGLKSIFARGEKAPGIGDTPQWLDVDYAFDNLNIFWTHNPPDVPGAADKNIGAYFEGDKGTLLCDYNTRMLTINGETMQDIPSIVQSIPRSPGHQQNFVDAVKSRNQPESNLEYARRLTLPMHLGLISWRLGRKLEWNDKREKFVGDKEADALLHRTYRKEWDLVGGIV